MQSGNRSTDSLSDSIVHQSLNLLKIPRLARHLVHRSALFTLDADAVTRLVNRHLAQPLGQLPIEPEVIQTVTNEPIHPELKRFLIIPYGVLLVATRTIVELDLKPTSQSPQTVGSTWRYKLTVPGDHEPTLDMNLNLSRQKVRRNTWKFDFRTATTESYATTEDLEDFLLFLQLAKAIPPQKNLPNREQKRL